MSYEYECYQTGAVGRGARPTQAITAAVGHASAEMVYPEIAKAMALIGTLKRRRGVLGGGGGRITWPAIAPGVGELRIL